MIDAVPDVGTYLELDGRPAVRFERIYAHPLERVWEAVSTSSGLGHWFPGDVDFDLGSGTVSFGGDPYTEGTEGRVLVWDPPRRLAFTWGDDELHFELEALDPRRCRFVLIDFLDECAAAARNATGWDVCLSELEKHVAGHPSGGPHGSGATPWQPLYDAYVARGLPSGAWIPTETP
ncbi:MAG: SRPBCC family protein [Acidimicrobiales bacterium]